MRSKNALITRFFQINLKKKLLENHELNRIMTHLGDSDRLSECRNVMPLLLIITLINNSQEAQNRMKECGYLTQLITMLCVSLVRKKKSDLRLSNFKDVIL